MSLKQMKDVMESPETGVVEKKESTQQIDSGTALQRFLNRIPISGIPGIKNSLGTITMLHSFFLFHLCFCLALFVLGSDLNIPFRKWFLLSNV